VHSATARDMARRWYGDVIADAIVLIPPTPDPEAVTEYHVLRTVADLYRNAIEAFHARQIHGPSAVIAAIASINDYAPDAKERASIAAALTVNYPLRWPVRRLWLDVDGLNANGPIVWLVDRMLEPPPGWCIELIEALPDGSGWRQATDLIARLLDIPPPPVCPVEPVPGDIALLAGDLGTPAVRSLRRTGARVAQCPSSGPAIFGMMSLPTERALSVVA
jgi:hypothetical protein